MVNKVILIGALGADPDIKPTKSNEPMAKMRIATNRRVQRNGHWEDETEWHNVIAFGKTVDFAEQYLKKGRQVYVLGRLQTSRWTDRVGVERMQTSIIVEELRALGKRAEDENTTRPAPASSGGYADEAPF